MVIFKEMVCEVEVKYKRTTVNRCKLHTSKDTVEFLRKVWNNDTIDYQESFFVIMLNRANNIVGFAALSKGSDTGTVVSPKMIMQLLLLSHATSFILAHNHPSGNLAPSDADRTITKQIKEAGKLMDIDLVDHIILTSDGYFSFADDGMI